MGSQISDNDINLILNKLNNQNCYISADSDEKGVAIDDKSPSKSFIKNSVILIFSIIIIIVFNFFFKPAYDFLFNNQINTTEAEKIMTMNYFWWGISAVIVFFSLLIGSIKSSSHLLFGGFYVLIFFVCIKSIIGELQWKWSIDPFKNPTSAGFMLAAFIIPLVSFILALTLKENNIIVDILGFLGYFLAIICGIIATLYARWT